MSQWCTTCYRRPYRSCDSSCPVFGKDHDELAEMVLKSKIVYCGNCKREGTDDCPMHINGAPRDDEFLASVATDFCSYGEEK